MSVFDSQKNSFFAIEGAGAKGIDQRDIMSLSVTEDMGKTLTGTLALRDPGLVYARTLLNNSPLQISWGYKVAGADITSAFTQATADQFTKQLERRGLNVFVTNPAGKGAQNGDRSFSCGFMSMGWFGATNFKTFDSGTKYSVVSGVMDSLGVAPDKRIILFQKSAESYSSQSVERQSETDFQFLARLSWEWRVVFRLGFASDGTTFGMFVDPMSVPAASTLIQTWIGTTIPIAPKFSYGQADIGDTPVINYDWGNEEGENGQGDNVRTVLVNGVMTCQRFTVAGDTVTVRVMDQAAITKYFSENGNDPEKIATLNAILTAHDFKNAAVQKFWSYAQQKTAPNGLGYTVKLHLFGMPSITAGMICTFNHGFPDVLIRTPAGSPVQFFIKSATHTINESGYFMDLEVVDLLTISAVGVL